MIRILTVLLCLTSLLAIRANAQQETDEKKLIQFSGVTIGDSIYPVPYAAILIKGSHRGTISDFYGYFSFVAQENDTIVFTSIGYQPSVFVIPDTLSTNRYSIIHIMEQDTVELREAVIYGYPTYPEFKKAFLNMTFPYDDMDRAVENLHRSQMKDAIVQTGMDASMNYKHYMQQYQTRLYYAGQYPPNNLLNPLSWAKFIQAWKNGDLKIDQ